MEPYPITYVGCHIDRKSSMHDLTYVERQTRKRMKQLEIHRWVLSIFCITLFLSWIPFLQAQEKRLIDLELNEVPLSTALRQLEREGGKNILFVNDEVEAYQVTVRIQKQPLAEAIREATVFDLQARYWEHERLLRQAETVVEALGEPSSM